MNLENAVGRETHTEMMQKMYFQQRFKTQQKGDKVGGGNSKAMSETGLSTESDKIVLRRKRRPEPTKPDSKTEHLFSMSVGDVFIYDHFGNAHIEEEQWC